MANVKEYPTPRVSAQPRAIEYLWENFSAFFSAKISLRKFPSSPQTKIWLLWQFPFPLRYDDIYDDTSVKPCTCSEAINKLAVTILKYRGKRQVNTDHVSYRGPRPIHWPIYRSIHRSILDRVSVDTLPSIGRYSIEYRSIYRSSIHRCIDR